MPLTEEQKAALKVIATVSSTDIDEAADALKNDAHPVYQRVFNAGHSTAQSAAKTEKATLEQQIATAKEEAATLQTQLDELKDKVPDRAQIDAQWQQKLDREKKALQDQIDAANSKVARLTTDTTVEKAENALLAAGIRPRLAKLLAKDAASRIKYGEDGSPALYEAGSEIPIQVPAGKTAFQVLAEQEKAAADPADLVSQADSGGGAGAGGGGGSNKWQQRREALQKEREGQKPSGPSVEERLGMASGAAT